MPSTPRSIISSKKARTELGSKPSKSVVLVVTRKPFSTASRMPAVASRNVPSRQTAKSWCSSWPSMCTEKVRYLLGVNMPSLSRFSSSRALVQR